MSEEKKKRFRPSLTAYREAEETVHRQCVELDAWREKYRQLDRQMKKFKKEMDAGKVVTRSEYDILLGEKRSLESRIALLEAIPDTQASELERLRSEVSTLEQSNKSMEGELKRKNNRWQADAKMWKEKAIECETELMHLRDRGFWQRLFNL